MNRRGAQTQRINHITVSAVRFLYVYSYKTALRSIGRPVDCQPYPAEMALGQADPVTPGLQPQSHHRDLRGWRPLLRDLLPGRVEKYSSSSEDATRWLIFSELHQLGSAISFQLNG